ncbi:MAG: hypothetical protein HC902_11780 [Calothrix sp. SM1_5_4]|nr:hypothetical protein [Calothrix sp. SM1_5_4]
MNTLGELMPISFTLAEIARVLKLGGKLHFVNQNPQYIRERKPSDTRCADKYPDDFCRIETRPIEQLGRHSFLTTIEYRSQLDYHFSTVQTLPDLESLSSTLKCAGFEVEEVYGDLQCKTPASEDSLFLNLYCSRISRKQPVQFERLNDFYDAFADQYENIAERGNTPFPGKSARPVNASRDND